MDLRTQISGDEENSEAHLKCGVPRRSEISKASDRQVHLSMAPPLYSAGAVNEGAPKTTEKTNKSRC